MTQSTNQSERGSRAGRRSPTRWASIQTALPIALYVAVTAFGFYVLFSRDQRVFEGPLAGLAGIGAFIAGTLVMFGIPYLLWVGAKKAGLFEWWKSLTAHDIADAVKVISVLVIVYEVLAWAGRSELWIVVVVLAVLAFLLADALDRHVKQTQSKMNDLRYSVSDGLHELAKAIEETDHRVDQLKR